MNKIYEFGGVADLLLRFSIEKEIDGVHYAANEPYTFLKDVNIQFNYDHNVKEIGGKTSTISVRDGRPKQLIIGGVALTQKIAHLIMTSLPDKNYLRTRRERIVCYKDGILVSNYSPQSGSIFAYDSSGDRIAVTHSDNTQIFGDFKCNVEYLIFYEQESAGDKYSFEIPHYPYFELDIFMKGNTNKISNDLYMHFNAVSLVAVPNLNITSGGILQTPLVFDIIYARQEEPIVVFE